MDDQVREAWTNLHLIHKQHFHDTLLACPWGMTNLFAIHDWHEKPVVHHFITNPCPWGTTKMSVRHNQPVMMHEQPVSKHDHPVCGAWPTCREEWPTCPWGMTHLSGKKLPTCPWYMSHLSVISLIAEDPSLIWLLSFSASSFILRVVELWFPSIFPYNH
jgi:hypothetical protein